MHVRRPLIRFIATLLLVAAGAVAGAGTAGAADDVFIYSSNSQIRGLNLTRQTDRLLTTSPIANAANALAVNSATGFVYYGDATRVFRWDPALGSGAAAHSLMMDFATGPIVAPITELNSTAGSFLDGIYYVGSEASDGTIEELYALQMSLDGTAVVSATPLGLLTACNCVPGDIGGFGDVAAIAEGGVPVLYGSSAAIGGGGSNSLAGRWKFTPSSGQFAFLTTAANGQMSTSLGGQLYSNVGNEVRTVDRVTGATGATTLFTTSAAIFDFTSGFQLDFGDAPDSYGAAFHRIGAGVTAHVGALAPDNDPGSLNAVTGLADGAGDDVEGIDDEDAIDGAAAVSIAAGGHAITVACSAGTRVAAWIDLDRDGRFDGNERNGNHPASCAAGSVTLQWNSLIGATGGASWLRLRASSNVAAISGPVGIAADGEVEDHPITIDAPVVGGGSCPAGSSATSFAANDLPLAIGLGGANDITSTISVPAGSGTVTDVNVIGVQGTHTWINDLRFRLSHAGTTRTLYGYSCNNEDDYSLSFDDEASGTSPCPPTDGGTYPPAQSLDAFDGTPADGNWLLQLDDRFPSEDGGNLTGWSLEICTVTATPALRLGKSATVIDREVTFTLALQNVGNVSVDDVQMLDDLDAVFGAGAYTIVSPPVVTGGPAGIAAAADYDGSTATALLANGGTLAVGERVDLVFTVRVDTLGGTPLGSYANSATAAATGAGTALTDVSNDGLDLAADGSAPTPITIAADGTLSGQVFLDTSADAALAHDGARQVDETGRAGTIVDLFDAGGVLLASATTDGDGRWTLPIDAALAGTPLTVAARVGADAVFVSEAAAFRDGQPADGRLTLTPAGGDDVIGLDIGVIGLPTLEADRALQGERGASTLFAHRYVAPTHGELTLGVTSGDGVQRRLLQDADCDGERDAVDAPIDAPVTLAPDEVSCLLVEVFVPPGAVPGSALQHDLTSTLVVSDPTSTGHAVTMIRTNRDRLTVLAPVAGQLVLEKRVRNVTRGESLTGSNAGLPGETLEYDIVYRNDGDGPVAELEIDDLAPAFSALVSGSVICADTPASLACTPVVGSATLGWRFTGALAPGEAGIVRYRVTID